MSLNPITREEKFLAKAGGEDVGELKPITRREQFLAKLAGGGSGGGGVMMVNVAYQDIAEGDSGMEFVGVSADKTHAEILGAINSGTFAVAILDMTLLGIGKMFLPLAGVMEYGGIANVAFSLQQGSEVFDVYVMTGDEWSAEITTAQ